MRRFILLDMTTFYVVKLFVLIFEILMSRTRKTLITRYEKDHKSVAMQEASHREDKIVDSEVLIIKLDWGDKARISAQCTICRYDTYFVNVWGASTSSYRLYTEQRKEQ